MRILQLDLLAFGPFTTHSLPLDGGNQGLHVVYGANEAGKSSALRALRQMLFGIPHISDDNFLHAHGDMRIGAKLVSASGETLECIRRKGKTNTLRASDDVTAIEPARLAEILGGLDEASFSLQFGIDNATLEEGGRAIVDGRGDLGVALFAAGSGIVDLRKIQQQLTEQAEALFKPRGSVQRINKALADLSRAKQEVKAAQLPTAEWVKHDEALRTAQDRKVVIDTALLQKRAERSRIERIAKTLPLVARRRTALEELQPVADAPLLPADFAERRRVAVAELSVNEGAELETSKLIEELERQTAELNPPPGLLEHRTTIEQLYADLGGYRKANRDRPGLEKQMQLLEDEARAILRDLGHPPDLRDVESLRITRAERQQVQSLGNDQKALEGKCASATDRAGRLKLELEQTEARIAGSGRLRDVAPLKQTIQRVRQHGDLDSRLATARVESSQLQQQTAIDLNRLNLWRGSLDDLEKIAVPATETIERFDAELGESVSELKGLLERIEEIDQNLRKLDQALERLRLEQDVPTEDDLASIRQRRDEGWQLVRRAWEENLAAGDAVQAFVTEFLPSGDLARAYETSVAQADNVADRLRREADHVAVKAKLIADRQETVERRADLTRKQEQAQNRHDLAQQEWLEQWQPLGIEPLTPREMRSWHGRHLALVNTAAAIRRQATNLKELESLAEGCRGDLDRSLAEYGQASAGTTESCASLLQRGDAVVERLDGEGALHQKLQQDFERLGTELTEAQRQVGQATGELNRWRDQWREVTRRLGMNEGASSDEANQVLGAIDELFAKLKQADDLQKRIQGIDRDAAQFAERLHQLDKLLSSGLVSQPVDQAVADLYDRLTQAQRIQVRSNELAAQRKREQTRLDKVRSDIRRLRAAIQTMCREAQCASAEQLPVAEQRSIQRQRHEEEIRQAEDRMLELSAGADLQAFIQETASVAADQLQPGIRQLTDEIEQLELERAEILQTIGSELNERKRMDGSARAAQADEEAGTLLAQIQSDAEQYRRLRLASGVLRSAIERYRERHQGPVVQRASDLFAELTLGSFEGLRADYNDSGQMVLVGVRSGGRQTVVVEAMSDGARDQLYLALRLASLETYLANKEPIPFIVDDILIKFDDERAVAALKALARLSERTQVIFFTHHEHLVDLAKENLDHDVLFRHRLNCRSVPPALASANESG